MTCTRSFRYANGHVDDVASILIAAHPRAEQYLSQAPVLAVLACRKFGTNITYGEADMFVELIDGEPKLRDVLRAYGASLPFRKIGAAGLRITDGFVLRELGRLDPSTLSQAIPSDSQRVWLDGITSWMALAPDDRDAYAEFTVEWIARRLGEDLSRFEQVNSLIDYVHRGRGEINPRWSWSRALSAVEEWHKSLRDERALRALIARNREAARFDTVICKAGLPDEIAVEG